MKPLGGQALLEGVMIKAPDNVSMAARTPGGKIVTHRRKHHSVSEKYKILGLPFLRGVIQLFEMMFVGIEALGWSAKQQGEEEDMGAKEWFFVVTFAVLLTVGLFILLPYYAAKFFFNPATISFGLLDGVVRLLVFLLYLTVIGLMSDVKTMFKYHAAEHMAVHCYESKKALNVKNVKTFPPEHPRCGTSLLLFVVAVSIILFSVVRSEFWYYNIPARILLLPVVAGISYELLKFSAKYRCLKWMSYPGVWTQKLTTRKPTAKQIEVAIAAVNKAK